MSRGMLAVYLILIVAASVTTAAARSVSPMAETCTDGSTFLSHVKYLANGYDPSGDTTNSPPSGSAIDSGSPYAGALENAFQLAPHAFRNHLCALDGIYINGIKCSDFNGCFANSWGYRTKNKQKYIAISAGLWSADRLLPYPGYSSYVYHLYETDVLNSVLGFGSSVSYRPQYASANSAADNFDMTILAALAHEMGHVRWYHLLNPSDPGGSNYEPKSFCVGTDGSTFFSNSWATVKKPPAWRKLLTRAARRADYADKHLEPPQMKEIDDDLASNLMLQASNLIDQIFQPAAPWASFFAATAPDEDFVETYKLHVLLNAQVISALNEGPLTSLKIQINDGLNRFYTEDIPEAYTNPPDHSNKSLLDAKLKCIGKSNSL